MDTLKARDFTVEELQQLLNGLKVPSGETVWCWLEAADGWTLDYWVGLDRDVTWYSAGEMPRLVAPRNRLPDIFQGRIFARSGELRWRVIPGLGQRCCRTVFLGSNWSTPLLDALEPRNVIRQYTSRIDRFPLWGQMTSQTPHEWIDLRIPHRLRYPVRVHPPPQGRIIVWMEVEIWQDSSGTPQFIRLRDLLAKTEN